MRPLLSTTYAIDGLGLVVIRKAIRRDKLLAFFEGLAPCLLGMEVCGMEACGMEACGMEA